MLRARNETLTSLKLAAIAEPRKTRAIAGISLAGWQFALLSRPSALRSNRSTFRSVFRCFRFWFESARFRLNATRFCPTRRPLWRPKPPIRSFLRRRFPRRNGKVCLDCSMSRKIFDRQRSKSKSGFRSIAERAFRARRCRCRKLCLCRKFPKNAVSV
jgi:hypothetical protein